MSIKPSASRMIALQIVLTLTIISNIIGAANAIRNFDAFLLANPKLNNVLGYVYVMSALIAVIGAYYLWSLKKSGLYVITIAFIAVIGLDLYAGISTQHILAASALFVLILIVLIPVRKYLN
ncbi:MAG TPA: hypothetical protein VJ455_10785 [Ignavibacteria bacterium]|nr:hypothetical protein [Ignavibacteria bacterium]